MNCLDDQAMAILADIFRQTRRTNSGVDALSYRANHEDLLDLIDKLERDGFLRKENEQYRVSLVVLSLINDDEARSMLDEFEKIFGPLKKHYKTAPHDPLKLTDLSNSVKISIGDLKEFLSYMVEGPWCEGHNVFYASEDAYVKPSESILRYKRFNDVIAKLQEWAKQRVSDRINREKSIAQGRASTVLPKGRRGPFDERTQRQKPEWHEMLDSEYRTLLDEVYLALANEMRALPAMGLRTVIDMICIKLDCDGGSFDKNLNKLLNDKHISKHEKDILAIAIDVGSASAHRGHFPTKEDLNTLLDIVEHQLKGIYVLPQKSQKLKDGTPKRKKSSSGSDK